MAQNITTLLEKPMAENVSGSDLLYIVQGTGSDRDRKITLSDLFASDPAHTLVVDESDTNPGRYLIGKFSGTSLPEGSTAGDVDFAAVTIRGARFIVGVIENQAVTTNKIADDAVTNAKIAAGAVSNGSLADGSVSTDKIIDGNVTPEKLVSTGNYAVGSVTATGSVNAGSIGVTGNATIGGNAGVNGDLTVSASRKLTAAGEARLGDSTLTKLTLMADSSGSGVSVFKADSTFDMTQRFTDGVEGEIKIVVNTNNQYDITVTCTTGNVTIPVHGAHMFIGMGSSSWFSIA